MSQLQLADCDAGRQEALIAPGDYSLPVSCHNCVQLLVADRDTAVCDWLVSLVTAAEIEFSPINVRPNWGQTDVMILPAYKCNHTI